MNDPLYAWMQTDYTCGCGHYIYPDNPHRNPKAIHIPDCPYGRVISLEVEVERLQEALRDVLDHNEGRNPREVARVALAALGEEAQDGR